MVSLVLPWGSAIYREGAITIQIITSNPISLLGAGDTLLMIGAALFIASTIGAFIDRWATVGQVTGIIVIVATLSGHLQALPVPSAITDGDVSVEILGFGIGMALGVASAAVVLATLLIEKRQGRFPAEETLPSEQRSTVTPEAWTIYQRFRNTGRP
jgi:hypothetical protein